METACDADDNKIDKENNNDNDSGDGDNLIDGTKQTFHYHC